MSRDKANERINRNSVSSASPKASPLKLPILVGVVVIVIAVAAVAIRSSMSTTKTTTRKASNVVVTENNIEEILEQMNETDYTPVGSYEVNMNFKWTFADGSSASSDAYVGNSVNNQNTVYCDIVLASDMEHMIYKSPFMEVGTHLESITLDEDLPAGDYDCVMTYHLVDGKMQDISEVSVGLSISIQN